MRIATEQRTQLRLDIGNEHTFGVSEGDSNPNPTRSRYRSVRYRGLTAIMQSPTPVRTPGTIPVQGLPPNMVQPVGALAVDVND